MTNSFVRQLNIDLITDTPNPIVEWFNNLWAKLSIIETDVYHKDGGEFIYYITLGERKQWIFLQDNKNDRFWCIQKYYWSILESKKDFKYSDIQEVTKLLVENALNTNNVVSITTPQELFRSESCKVENALNNSITTPIHRNGEYISRVENALNNNNVISVTIPPPDGKYYIYGVENVLNNYQ